MNKGDVKYLLIPKPEDIASQAFIFRIGNTSL